MSVHSAAVWTLRRPGFGRRGNRLGVLRAVVALGRSCVLSGLERTHDVLGGQSVPVERPEGVAAVEFRTGLQLRERRAVGRHRVIGEAEREGREVLFRLAGRGNGGRGLGGLALFAAFTSILEVPGAVGARRDRLVPSSAVGSRHRHPKGNSTTII